jgi:hypothetical protein
MSHEPGGLDSDTAAQPAKTYWLSSSRSDKEINPH